MCGLFENGFFLTIIIYVILSYFLHQNISDVGVSKVNREPETGDKIDWIKKLFRDVTIYTPLGQKIKLARNVTTAFFVVFLGLTTVCPT